MPAKITFPSPGQPQDGVSTGSFLVERVDSAASYYAGRTSMGQVCLLVETPDAGRTVPLLLVGLEVHFSFPCRIREGAGSERIETLTAVVCLSRDAATEEYFASVCEMLMQQIGAEPTAVAVEEGILFLVDLFRKLGAPAKRELLGLVGELCVIHEAPDAGRAVTAWRSDHSDRFDFAEAALRIEAKASSLRDRRHSFSLEQTRPASGTTAFVASVHVEALGGGTSLAGLIQAIERRLTDPATVGRFRLVIADSLGDGLPLALRWRFDLELAQASIRFFDISAIPTIRGPIPTGVSQIRFVSDLSSCISIIGSAWEGV